MKTKIIDIDLEFDGFKLDERAINRATGYAKSSQSHTGQKRSAEQKVNMSLWQKGLTKTEEHKEKIGNSLRGKTLEELLGEERAAAGKQARRQTHLGKKRPKEVGGKIAATRRANGSYDVGAMTGKQHKESTKSIMSQKAEIRQELKRKHGLGKSDKVPQELLEQAYKKAGLI